MASERERMLAGELYDAFDPQLVALRVRARELFRAGGDTALVEPPFHCDYGANIRLPRRAVDRMIG